MNPVSALRASVSIRSAVSALALLTPSAGTSAAAAPADAARSIIRTPIPDTAQPELAVSGRASRNARDAAKKQKTPESRRPRLIRRVPLVIAISIGSQHVKVYDANGLFAEAPVSTGMAGHPDSDGRVQRDREAERTTTRISIAAPRCRSCSASPGAASRCMPACCPAIRPRTAASACRRLRHQDVWLDQDGRARRSSLPARCRRRRRSRIRSWPPTRSCRSRSSPSRRRS